MYRDFFRNLESEFSLEKIIMDICEYLSITTIGSVTIVSSHVIHGDEKTFLYSSSLPHEILSIRAEKRYLLLSHLPYQVEVLIGEFNPDDALPYVNPNVFRAVMFYNSGFQLTTIDFEYDYWMPN